MAFVANNAQLRTYDPERNLELISEGSGSDGVRYFRISSPDGDVNFSVRMEAEKVPLEDHDPGQLDTIIVWVVSHCRGVFLHVGVDNTDSIIRDAMEAYKGSHGIPFDQQVKVIFN